MKQLTYFILIVSLQFAFGDTSFAAGNKSKITEACETALISLGDRRHSQNIQTYKFDDAIPGVQVPSKDKLRELMAQDPESVIKLVEKLQRAHDETASNYRAALIHPLTKMYNRIAFEKIMLRLTQHADENKIPLVFISIDLNKFKQVNDRLSHTMGDDLMSQVAAVLASNMADTRRDSDFLFHIGGDEFLLVLQNASEDVALNIIKRISSHIKTHPVIKKISENILAKAAQKDERGRNERLELEASLGPDWEALVKAGYVGSLSYGLVTRIPGEFYLDAKMRADAKLEELS